MNTRIALLMAVLFAFSLSCDDGGGDGGGGAECGAGTYEFCNTTCDTQGTQQCDTAGQWGQCNPPPETCNTVDDDCDGQTDEGLQCGSTCTPRSQQPCFTSCDSVGSQSCDNSGHWSACQPPAELCNEQDDNCDGKVDEGLQCSTDEPCDEGKNQTCLTACQTIGQVTCSNGEWGACTKAEECNNIDDDCDGKTDEDISQACQTICGIGTQACQAGSWTVCDGAQPKAEECNGQDDDCDGKTDEDVNGTALTQSCEQCGAGHQECSNGNWGTCSAQPETEICDGLDNDCNGKIDDAPGGCTCDNGEVAACGTDLGECNPGQKTCTNGDWSDCGGPNYKGPVNEICDGLDNNCDGLTDEGNPDGGAICGTPNVYEDGTSDFWPPCQQGFMTCKGGQLFCDGGVNPSAEICDDIDNNCDGLVDNAITGDQYELNDECATATDLGKVIEGQGKQTYKPTMFPDGDVDWLLITAAELSNFCLIGDGPFTLTVHLKDIPADTDYDLCVWSEDDADCSTLSDTGPCEDLGIWKAGAEPETFTHSWEGNCMGNDDLLFYVKVVNYWEDMPFNCAPYSLQFEVTSP